MKLPKPGDRLHALTPISGGPLGDDVVTVREVVKADEPGAHNDEEDAVVIEWEEPGLTNTETGLVRAPVLRAMSIGVSDLDGFEKA